MNVKIFLSSLVGLLLSAILVFGLFQLIQALPDHGLTLVFVAWLVLMVMAYRGSHRFKATEGDEGLVIYQDYYDLFKCLSVVAVPIGLFFIGAYLGQPEAAKISALIFSVGMTLHICYESAKLNKLTDLPIVYLIKFSTSFLWFLAAMQALNPAGKNNSARRTNRAIAATVLLILTPVINMLVLDDSGKNLIRHKFRGRRFAGASLIRNAMDS